MSTVLEAPEATPLAEVAPGIAADLEAVFESTQAATQAAQETGMTPKIEPAAPGNKLDQKAICLQLTVSQPGKWRKGDIAKVETQADKKSLGIRKKVVAHERWEKLLAVRGEVEGWIDRRVIPSFFRKGQYLLPVDVLNEVEEYLQKMKVRQQELLESFLEVYPEAIEEARERLKDQFKERNYPAPEVLRGRFGIRWNYLQFQATPTSLKEVNQELFKLQQEKYAKLWDEVFQDARTFLRAELADVVSTLEKELTPKEDGKPRRVYESVVNKFKDFLDYFDARNITDDTELADMVKRCRKIMSGVNLKDLKDKEGSVKQIVQKSLAQVKEKLSQPGFIVTQTRVYDFEDAVEAQEAAEAAE